MTGRVYGPDGSFLSIPPLLTWELTHTAGEPCGYCSITFLTTGVWGSSISQGALLTLDENGVSYFTGIVDEVSFAASDKGLVGAIYGRDLAAKLLDNQARSGEFATAYWQDILSRYVMPCGITAVRADDLPPVAGFAVGSGQSCWRVLEGFCRHSANIRPRFLPDGTLALGYGSGDVHILNHRAPIVSLEWSRDLAQELSAITEVDTYRKTVTTTHNPRWKGLGTRHQVIVNSSRTLKADWETPGQRLLESSQNGEVLTVKVAGRTGYLPLDMLEVSLEKWGIAGGFSLTQVTNSCSMGQEIATLVARRI